jgi:uncharacterized protein (TIGR02001 family)
MICIAGQCSKIHPAHKFLCATGWRIQVVHQMVHKTTRAHEIGAHIFCGNHTATLIHCLISKNNFGTDAADVIVRIMLSRSQLKKGIMMKSKLLNSLILAALAVPGVVMAADAPPPPPVTGNVALVTDYLYRGISQTGGGPAIQGGFDYAHSSGFYAGVWGSSISWISDSATGSNAGLELDTYFGFKNSFATDFSYDVGFLRYNYPGKYGTLSAPYAKPDTNEIYGLIGWKWITLKYSNSLGDTFGVSDASGTSYIDLSASYTLEGSGVTLGAHYGEQKYKGSSADMLVAAGTDPSYSDYNVSVAKDFSGYVIGLKYSDTNVKKGGYYSWLSADGSTTDWGKSTVVLSVTHSM